MESDTPWWWRCSVYNGKAEEIKSKEASANLNETALIFSEEILKEKHIDPVLADDERILASYRNDREDLRAVIPPILQSSGLLLSLSLGAIYFILKDGHGITANFSLIVTLLILISLSLVGSILSGVWALYKRPSTEGVTKKDLIEYERRSRSKDHLWGGVSVGIMIIAVLGIVTMLAIFWSECSHLDITSNSSGNGGQMVMVLVVSPNYLNTSSIFGLNDSDHKYLFIDGSIGHGLEFKNFPQEMKLVGKPTLHYKFLKP
ncbi:MAG: hypothetical protein ACP5PV_09460 [Methanothrix sp.]